MVVGNFLVIKYLLRFSQRLFSFAPIGFLPKQRRRLREIVLYTLQGSRHFGVNIIGEIGSIHARIGRYTLLVKRLNEFQRLVGRESVFLVTLHLETRQIKEFRCRLCALLLLHSGDAERIILYRRHQTLALLQRSNGIFIFFRGQLCAKQRITIHRFQLPIRLRHETLYLRLPLHHQCQSRSLHTPDREHLSVFSRSTRITYSVRARGVHPQKPITDSAHQSSLVEMLVIRLVFQLPKALCNSLFRQRTDPQSLHRHLASCLLIHPPLNEFPLLPGITTVNHLIGLRDKRLNHIKLLMHPIIAAHLDTKSLRDHR